MKRLAAVACLVSWAAVQTAQAYVSYANAAGQPQKWSLALPSPFVHTNVVNRGTKAVRYFLAADAYSAAHREAELQAARVCFDQWQAVPGSILRFEEGGLMSGHLDINTADNTNLVYWAKTSTLVNNGLDNIRGATGVTFFDSFTDSTRAEADIVLNGVDYTWSTDFNNAGQSYLIESVLLHEIGHFVGLAHSPVGASTMFPRGSAGVNVQVGLSPDEIAGVHALYPAATIPPTLGRLSGRVMLRGAPVFGAVVIAEDSAGNVIAGTVTRSDGMFDMQAMPPGAYQVRVCPVDPTDLRYQNFFLFRGKDVAPEFTSAEPGFLATTNTPVSIVAGKISTLNFAVTGTPNFRIGRIRPPTTDPSVRVVVNYAVALERGQSNVTVGVYSVDVPGPEAVLRITGDGIHYGPTTYWANAFPDVKPPLNLLSVQLDVAANAAPGMRTFVVEQQSGLACANGFLEIAPPFPDGNFDGLDDRFQRQYFPRWTAPEAAPGADPDQDGFINSAENLAGSDPTDASSVLRVESVRVDAAGATVTWPSAPGRHYQVFSRPQVNSIRGWQAVGEPVTATGNEAQFLDTTPGNGTRFYRIQAVP